MLSQQELNVSMATDIIHRRNIHFGYDKYSHIPLKATENVKEVLQDLDDNYNNALFVAGSLDQVLEAVMHHIKNFQIFDINHLANMGCSLKYAAIKALNYEEFLKFYGVATGTCFPKNLYAKVRVYLDNETLYFWDQLFSMYSGFNVALRLFDLAHHSANPFADPYISLYSEEEYYLIKQNLLDTQISFTPCNLFDIGDFPLGDKQYDLIYLSNIYAYLNRLEREAFPSFLAGNIVPLLSDNGCLFANYFYGRYTTKEEALKEGHLKEYLELEQFKARLEQETGLVVIQYAVEKSGYGHPWGTHDISLCLKRKR